MNAIDIFLLAVIGIAVAYGLYKGLVRQIASLGGLILGIIACRLFSPDFAEVLIGWFPSTFTDVNVAVVVAAIIIYLVVYFSVGALALLAHKLTHALMVGWLDHLLGAVFSVFKWLLIASILLNLWHIIAPESPVFSSSALMGGKLFNFVIRLAPELFGVVSDHISGEVANIL